MYLTETDSPPTEKLQSGSYSLRFATGQEDLNQVFRLRYRVFNVELNEGFDASHETGLDTDAFDAQCHHLLVTQEQDDRCVGTYRLQTAAMAASGSGFYTATEFDLNTVPEAVLSRSIEAGRACIDADHRSLNVLHLLWRGLGMYLSHNHMRYLFGCCSLTSQCASEGLAVLRYLEKEDYMNPDFRVLPLPDQQLPITTEPRTLDHSVKIPRLMRAYLAHGARICGPPAIDRAFKTIDYLALFDTNDLSANSQTYFGIRT